MKLPRAICPVCEKEVAVRRNGELRELREHRVYKSQLEQDTSKHLGRMRICEGSGRKPE